MIKTTEYDMPDELLELADVTEAKAATQPVYNDDLAEVVNQAFEHVPTVPGDGKAREMNPDLFEHATNDDVTIKDNSLTNRYIANSAIDFRNFKGSENFHDILTMNGQTPYSALAEAAYLSSRKLGSDNWMLETVDWTPQHTPTTTHVAIFTQEITEATTTVSIDSNDICAPLYVPDGVQITEFVPYDTHTHTRGHFTLEGTPDIPGLRFVYFTLESSDKVPTAPAPSYPQQDEEE